MIKIIQSAWFDDVEYYSLMQNVSISKITSLFQLMNYVHMWNIQCKITQKTWIYMRRTEKQGQKCAMNYCWAFVLQRNRELKQMAFDDKCSIFSQFSEIISNGRLVPVHRPNVFICTTMRCTRTRTCVISLNSHSQNKTEKKCAKIKWNDDMQNFLSLWRIFVKIVFKRFSYSWI